MSYHSKFNSIAAPEEACGMPIYAFTATGVYNADASTYDIVDEAIHLYRANIFFKNYPIEGPADRVTVFLTCYIQKCLE